MMRGFGFDIHYIRATVEPLYLVLQFFGVIFVCRRNPSPFRAAWALYFGSREVSA